MAQTTLAEALARLKRIDEQIQKKQRLILAYLFRRGDLRDPLEREGGTTAVLQRELESVRVLSEQKVEIRRTVQAAYDRTPVTVERRTQSIRDWLVWRREAAPGQAAFLKALQARIEVARREASRAVAARRPDPAAATPGAFFVNLDERDLARDIESWEETLGALEGQLSLKSATTPVEVPPEDAGRTGIEGTIDLLLKRAGAADAPPAAAAVPTTSGPAPAATRRVSLTLAPAESMSEEVRRLARDLSKKIHAIKLHREQTGLGLKEAKDAVEAFIASGR